MASKADELLDYEEEEEVADKGAAAEDGKDAKK